MPDATHLLAIDQGAISVRAIVYGPAFGPVAAAQIESAQHFPHDGWNEHAPPGIIDAAIAMSRLALKMAEIRAESLAGIAIADQCETAIVWDRATGEPIFPAIVSADCRGLRAPVGGRDETLRRSRNRAALAGNALWLG